MPTNMTSNTTTASASYLIYEWYSQLPFVMPQGEYIRYVVETASDDPPPEPEPPDIDRKEWSDFMDSIPD